MMHSWLSFDCIFLELRSCLFFRGEMEVFIGTGVELLLIFFFNYFNFFMINANDLAKYLRNHLKSLFKNDLFNSKNFLNNYDNMRNYSLLLEYVMA